MTFDRIPATVRQRIGAKLDRIELDSGVRILLAVESGLPAVRASLFGMAALIAPDGTILRASQPGQSGVLTLDGDWPAHIRRPVRRSHNRPALTRSFKRRRVPSIGAGKARPEKLSPT